MIDDYTDRSTRRWQGRASFPPRHPMLRYHGCFAANHKLRSRVVPQTAPEQAAPRPKKSRRRRVEDSAAAKLPGEPASVDTPPRSLRRGLAVVNTPLDWAPLLKRVAKTSPAIR